MAGNKHPETENPEALGPSFFTGTKLGRFLSRGGVVRVFGAGTAFVAPLVLPAIVKEARGGRLDASGDIEAAKKLEAALRESAAEDRRQADREEKKAYDEYYKGIRDDYFRLLNEYGFSPKNAIKALLQTGYSKEELMKAQIYGVGGN